MHILSVNMSALPHCQVGDKQEWSDNRDYTVLEIPTRVRFYVLKANCEWRKFVKTNRCCCTVRHMITLHILQYSYSIMTGSATLCCCIDCINCTGVDGWKKYTWVMAVATEMLLQWHCLLNNVVCSTATDCCSTLRHKLLETERCVTSYTVTIE
jgi:hypothetical protein